MLELEQWPPPITPAAGVTTGRCTLCLRDYHLNQEGKLIVKCPACGGMVHSAVHIHAEDSPPAEISENFTDWISKRMGISNFQSEPETVQQLVRDAYRAGRLNGRERS